MSEYARITPAGGIRIDTNAWIAARTGGVVDEATQALRDWAHRRGQPPPQVMAGTAGQPEVARAWCDQAGYPVREPGLVIHQHTRLDTDVWVLPTVLPGPGPVAVIATTTTRMTVHTDTTTDPWVWCDADTVAITCPAGHHWTWRSGRELLTATGRATTLTVAFGANLDAPFTRCPVCAAYDLGQRTSPCGCDGTPWIVCPTCGRRAHLSAPAR